MKSRLVSKVKEDIAEQYGFNHVENSLTQINQRIDFLLEKHRFFCKYQDVDLFTL